MLSWWSPVFLSLQFYLSLSYHHISNCTTGCLLCHLGGLGDLVRLKFLLPLFFLAKVSNLFYLASFLLLLLKLIDLLNLIQEKFVLNLSLYLRALNGAFCFEERLHNDEVKKNDDSNWEKHLHSRIILLIGIDLEDTVLCKESELKKIERKSIISWLPCTHIDVHILDWLNEFHPLSESLWRWPEKPFALWKSLIRDRLDVRSRHIFLRWVWTSKACYMGLLALIHLRTDICLLISIKPRLMRRFLLLVFG